MHKQYFCFASFNCNVICQNLLPVWLDLKINPHWVVYISVPLVLSDLEVLIYFAFAGERGRNELTHYTLYYFPAALLSTFLHKKYRSYRRREVIGGRISHWISISEEILCIASTKHYHVSDHKVNFNFKTVYITVNIFCLLLSSLFISRLVLTLTLGEILPRARAIPPATQATQATQYLILHGVDIILAERKRYRGQQRKRRGWGEKFSFLDMLWLHE